jgi:hypothetical protein
MLDRICARRAEGYSWVAIENDSPHWPEWDQLDPALRACFPGLRLPHSNLHRWYDLRICQAGLRREDRSFAADAVVRRLAGGPFDDLPDAIKTTLGQLALAVLSAGGNPLLQRKGLLCLARLLARFQANEIARQRLEIKKQRMELLAARVQLLQALGRRRPPNGPRRPAPEMQREGSVPGAHSGSAAADSVVRETPSSPASSPLRRADLRLMQPGKRLDGPPSLAPAIAQNRLPLRSMRGAATGGSGGLQVAGFEAESNGPSGPVE